MIETEIGNSRRGAEAQIAPVKTSASPRSREKIKTKDSGIPWIGEIPADWEIKRLKNVATLNPKTFFRLDETDHASFVPMECLRLGNIEKVERIYSELASHTPFSEGDILVAKVTPCFENKNIAVAKNLTNGVGFASSEIFIFRATAIDSQFLFYLFVSEYINAIGVSSMTGTGGLKRVSTNIVSCKIPVPPAGTQKRIAEFLDKKCAEIDALIALQEKMITELKSYKQSVITEAVTRGVPANIKTSRGDTEPRNVPLKDSGIPWLGSIPAHWDVKQLARVSNVVRGASPRPAGDPQYFHGDFIPWITVAEVTKDDGKFIFETETFLTESGMQNSRVIEPETLLLSNSGATLGVPKISKIRGCINDGSVAFLSLTESKEFLFYVLKSRTMELRRQMQGSGQPNLNTQIVKSMFVPVPPQNEQKAIVDFLDQKCAEIDSLVSLKQQKIATLQNYKKSVIFEYVTGKNEA